MRARPRARPPSEIYFHWKIFTFLASLFRFMLFTLCGKYSGTNCVVDSIIAVWARNLFTKIVLEPHVSAKCEYGRMQILAEQINTLVALYSEAASIKIFRDFRIIFTLFLLTLNKSVLIKF